MYLSLPLPSTSTRPMTVTVVSGDGSALPMPLTVTVPKNGCCRDLHRALIVECGLASSEDLLLAEVIFLFIHSLFTFHAKSLFSSKQSLLLQVFENRIYRYLDGFDSISGIKNEDHLVAYRLPTNYKEFVRLEIMHRRTER